MNNLPKVVKAELPGVEPAISLKSRVQPSTVTPPGYTYLAATTEENKIKLRVSYSNTSYIITRSAQHAVSVIKRSSVRPSVCLSRRSTAAAATAGLILSPRMGDMMLLRWGKSGVEELTG